VKLAPFVDVRPFAELGDLFAAASRHELRRRMIVTPAAVRLESAGRKLERTTA